MVRKTKLVALSGPTNPMDLNRFLQLNDFSAGVIFLKRLTDMNPNLKWGDLLPENYVTAFENNPVLAGWDWYNPFSWKLGRKAKNIVKDTIDYAGKKGGEAIRLLADEDVSNAVGRAVGAYVTGGGTEAMRVIDRPYGDNGEPDPDPKKQGIFASIFSIFGAGAKDSGEKTENLKKIAIGSAIAVGLTLIILTMVRAVGVKKTNV